MAIEAQERWLSPRIRDSVYGQNDRVSIRYTLKADAGESPEDVRDWAIGNLPLEYLEFARTDIVLQRLEADGYWEAEANYTNKSNSQAFAQLEPGQYRWGIRSAGGGSFRRFFSEQFIEERSSDRKYEFAGTEPEIERTVGLTSDGQRQLKSEGVDDTVGSVQIWVRTAFSQEQVSEGALVTIASYAANRVVNATAWNGFAAKTLRLEEFDSEARADDEVYDVGYVFDFSPTQVITGLISGMDPLIVPGQYRLEVMRRPRLVKDETTQFELTVPAVTRLAVHRMRPEIDYSSGLFI